MITITRLLARQLKTIFRRAMNGATRGSVAVPIRLIGGPGGLRIQAVSQKVAVEYFDACEQEDEQLVLPFHFLEDCEGNTSELARFELAKPGQIMASWTDKNVPQIVTYAPDLVVDTFPEWPSDSQMNDSQILCALHEAMQTADDVSTRYALSNVQLRGDTGTIAATDGSQLLIQSGFTFGWANAVLIPKAAVFASKELPRSLPVLVGKSNDWVGARIGPWTFFLRINHDARFPDLSDQIKPREAATSVARISADDAEFLRKSLPSLPCDNETNYPITVELNGSVAVRGKSTDCERPVEIVLRGSTRTGPDVRINSNRKFLERAIRLGFRELYIYDADAPVHCQDERRRYLWALLDSKDAVKQSADTIRIESPHDATTEQPPHNEERTENNVTTSKDDHNRSPDSNGNATPEAGIDELIEQAEQLKVSLREALTKTNDFAINLKRHRKQSKLVRTTLESLRQLQTLKA